MKLLFPTSVILSLCGTLMAAPSLIGNGSFEGTEMQKGANWGTRHQFIRGKGRVEIVEENGNRVLKVSMDEPNSTVKVLAGKVRFRPDTAYSVRFRCRRPDRTTWPNLTIVYRLKDGRSGSEQFQINTKKVKNEKPDQWLVLGPEMIGATLWLPPGSAKRYVGLPDGKVFFDSSVFGTEILECEVFLTISGSREIRIDDLFIEEDPPKTHAALAADAEAERQRLLIDATAKANRELAEARKKKSKIKLNFQIPLKTDFPPLKTDFSSYPDSVMNIAFDGARVLRNGKPVMMLGAEMLDPYTMKMFGLDYWVKSAFLNFLEVRQEKGVMTLSPPPRYPFLESELKHCLNNGIPVWIDLLTGNGGRARPIMQAFPELFTTGGHFFAWNQERPESRAILRSLWKSVLDQSRKYPVLFYEMFNEVVYEDKSPANIARFQKDLKEKYRTIEALNRACGTDFASFSEAAPQGYRGVQDLLKPQSENLKAEWTRFTEKRFAEIADESYAFFRKAVTPYSKISFQSVCGFPDYTDAVTDPVNSYRKQDYKGLEITAVFYPQTGKTDDEEAIAAEARATRIVKFFRGMEREKPAFDGEMSIFPGSVTFTQENVVSDFGKKMKFRPGAYGKESVADDRGRREKWHLPDYDDSDWKTLPIPSLWGKSGYPQCTVGYYRADVTPEKIPGRRIYLCGSELADRAEIYLNGERIGNTMRHFETFTIDVTEKLRYGEKNVFAVRIENTYLRNGYYWGGIRTNLVLLDTPGYSSTRFSPEQMDFLLWQRAMLGYNGTCLSYFYMNWTDPSRCALQNPIFFDPAIWMKVPETKNRINDLGSVIYPKRQPESPVGICFSLESARGYVSSKQYTSTERSEDFDRYFAASSFLQRDTGVFSDETLEDYSRLKNYRAVLLRLTERVSKKAMKNLERYVREGGVVLVDRLSLTRSSFDNSPLDASAFLGVKRGKGIRSPGHVRIRGEKNSEPTRPSGIRGHDHYAPLQILDAEEVAWIGTTPVAAIRRSGKGAVLTISAELRIPGLKKLFRPLFEEFRIPAEVNLSGAEYVDVYPAASEGRHLFGLFNWGGTRQVRLSDFRLPPGEYRLRDAATGEEILPPGGGSWNARTLKAGFRRTISNFVPALFLFERTDLAPLKLTDIPAGQKEALKKFWAPFWKDPEKVRKRILWFGRTQYTPIRMSSAVKILHDSGIAVDCQISRTFDSSTVQVIRNGVPLHVPLSDYDLIVLPNMTEPLAASRLTALREYLKTGGKSLLLLGTHSREVHYAYPGKNREVLKLVGGNASWSPVLDGKNARYGDPYFFRTGQIRPHDVTKGVREFSSLGSCAVSLKGGTDLVLSEKSAKPAGKAVLSVREEGSSRIAFSGDSDWITPLGLASADNAVLWSNLMAWLCRVSPLSEAEAREAARLPEF